MFCNYLGRSEGLCAASLSQLLIFLWSMVVSAFGLGRRLMLLCMYSSLPRLILEWWRESETYNFVPPLFLLFSAIMAVTKEITLLDAR